VYASRMAANGLLLMIAGLIALAAGNALVIDHPTREATLALVLMLFGGPLCSCWRAPGTCGWCSAPRRARSS
jgi:low temperature requirement protein LtrA